MRAAYLNKVTGPEGLSLGDLPRPSAADGKVVVQVLATAVTPTEFEWSPTFKTPQGEPRLFPIVLGHEFSGVIAEIGPGVVEMNVGDAVYGLNDWFVNGAQAEYCLAPAAALAPKPSSLTDAAAATVPISALTAWQGLFERCKLQAGERVLIHGGAGAVGLFAVQLAHWRGAYVLATAASRNIDFVGGLGADEVIDYQEIGFENFAQGLDVVFDVIGGETLQRSWKVLRPGGRLVTIAASSQASEEQRAREAFFIVEPNRAQLSEISRLLDAGTLRAFAAEVFPLEQVREAYSRAQQGGKRGKIALQVASRA